MSEKWFSEMWEGVKIEWEWGHRGRVDRRPDTDGWLMTRLTPSCSVPGTPPGWRHGHGQCEWPLALVTPPLDIAAVIRWASHQSCLIGKLQQQSRTAFYIMQKSRNLLPKITGFYDIFFQKYLTCFLLLFACFLDSCLKAKCWSSKSVGPSLEIFIFSIKYLNKRW